MRRKERKKKRKMREETGFIYTFWRRISLQQGNRKKKEQEPRIHKPELCSGRFCKSLVSSFCPETFFFLFFSFCRCRALPGLILFFSATARAGSPRRQGFFFLAGMTDAGGWCWARAGIVNLHMTTPLCTLRPAPKPQPTPTTDGPSHHRSGFWHEPWPKR